MRRILLLSIVAGLTALLGVGTAQGGVRHETAALQIALKARGLYPGPLDGIAGGGTVSALSSFQSRAGLPASGRLDRRSRLALGPLGRPLGGQRALTLAMVGWDVSVLEFRLSQLGFFPGKVDGRFTTDTRKAVQRFQAFAALGVDGAAGATTFRALLQARRPRSPIALAWPLQRPVTRAFGMQEGTFAPGVELAAPYATGVAAAADGRIVWAGWRPGGLGLVVAIDHGDRVQTLYGHLARVDVKVGQRVVRGEMIGLVGWTGKASTPHLYLEVRVRGLAIDPARALS